MTERMSDEDLGRAIDEAGSSIPKDAINPATGKPFGTGNVPAMHAAMGAAARRLVHEDDALAMIERLTAERDAALAKLAAFVRGASLKIPTRTMEYEFQQYFRRGFERGRQAGAEAMREACRLEARNIADEIRAGFPGAIPMHEALQQVMDAIRALPLPAHQSSTQTGTSPTTGHS